MIRISTMPRYRSIVVLDMGRSLRRVTRSIVVRIRGGIGHDGSRSIRVRSGSQRRTRSIRVTVSIEDRCVNAAMETARHTAVIVRLIGLGLEHTQAHVQSAKAVASHPSRRGSDDNGQHPTS